MSIRERVALISGIAALALLVAPGAHSAGTIQIESVYSVQVTTLKEVRLRESFRRTARQQYDFSCGSAALATLLSYHYGHVVSEEAIFRAMFEIGDQEKIRKQGFSLLDIKRYLETNGYQADGFEASLDQLAEARTPALVLIRENGYNHFVVVKGLRDDKVLIGDPAMGTRILPRPDFEAMWIEKILFVIHDQKEAAHFNDPTDWIIRRPAPLAQGINREAMPGFMMPTANDF